MRIINEKKKSYMITPSDNTLVIYLRTGDVLGTYKHHSLFKKYTKPVSFYSNILHSGCLSQTIKHIVIVTGFHKKDWIGIKNSLDYVYEVCSLFKNYGYTVDTRINENVDEDVIYMCHSKHFIGSGGGFSKLVKLVVKQNKGTVYE